MNDEAEREAWVREIGRLLSMAHGHATMLRNQRYNDCPWTDPDEEPLFDDVARRLLNMRPDIIDDFRRRHARSPATEVEWNKMVRAFLGQYAWVLAADVVALVIAWVTMPFLTIDHQRPGGAVAALILAGVVFAVLSVPAAVDVSRRRR